MRFRNLIATSLVFQLAAATPVLARAKSPDKRVPLVVAARTPGLPPLKAAVQRSVLTANAAARTFMRQQIASKKIPGAQIAVVQHGRVILSEAFGFANLEHRVAVTPDTVFPINSATKSFTGVAVMQLVEAGKLDLDAPVSHYIEDLPPAWRNVRVRQLLGHISGLPDIIGRNGLIGDGTEKGAWAAVKALPVESAPGTRFEYNQTNYALLARIIDTLSGMKFTDHFAVHQFKPAGMMHARFGDGFDIVPDAATPYSFYGSGHGGAATNELGRWRDDLPPFTRTGAGINASAREIARWIIALQAGKLLANPDSLKQLWSADTLSSGDRNAWALGWPIVRAAPHPIVGGIGGGRAAFFVYPEDDLAVIVLTNLVGSDPQQFIDKIAAFYVPSIATAAAPN